MANMDLTNINGHRGAALTGGGTSGGPYGVGAA